MNSIKFIFSSLFSNQKIIDESKKRPWWLAIIIFILSLVIAIVPVTISYMNVKGSNVLTASTNYSLDLSVKQLSYQLSNLEGVEASVKNKEFSMTKDDKDYTEPIKVATDDGTWLMNTIYVPLTSTDKNYTNELNRVKKDLSLLDKIAKEPDSSLESDHFQSYVHSMMIFTKSEFHLYVYEGSAKVTYKEDDKGVIEIVTDASTKGTMIGTFDKVEGKCAQISSFYDKSLSHSEAIEKSYDLWVDFLDKAYEAPRNKAAINVTLVYSGINFLIIIVMSLTAFLLSRLKSSIRKYSFLQSLKMISFASLSPSLIGLLLGLLIPSTQAVSFIVCIGLRSTWLIMKATSPASNSGGAIRK